MSLACMELLVVWNTPQPTVLAATLTASPIPTPTSTLPATLSPTPVVVVISPTPPTLYTPPLITPSGPPPASPTAEQSVANIYTGLTLVSPSPEMKFPVNIQAVEFQWKWDAKPQCGAPPNAYGFLIQIWRKDDGTPLGAMDAATDRLYIFCNPDTGIYNYKLNDLRDAPGVGRRELGVGKFYWNVAYVELNPFKIISQSAPNTFEITLEYTGPKDPHGFDLNCSDFASWGEAQAIFLAAGGPEQDLHRLDPDTNGYACDQLR
ncbi:MAG: excalibur calcium-binding domain-containing protein [Anaerolineales bacterium]|nr:excalibur calcium-binding domain-containing protein [Anaerolineales bacterium]